MVSNRRRAARMRQIKRLARSGVIFLLPCVFIGYGLSRVTFGSAGQHDPWSPPSSTSGAPGASGASGANAGKSPGQGTSGTDIPESGTGRFAVAKGGGEHAGTTGRLVRYRVEVEGGIPIDPASFGSVVTATLGDPRGWTAGGQFSFQRVDGGNADVVIHLATPKTVDRICGQYGLSTHGEVSCRGGSNVMINYKRWQLGVAWYADALGDYRNMLVNHEVGHFLGNGHAACPGKGKLAPVMQTQTLDLNGCTRNPWPYPDGHNLVTGPAAR